MADTTYQFKTDQKTAFTPDADVNEAIIDINRNFAEKKVITKAQKTKLPYVDIENTPINPDLIQKTDIQAAEKSLALPFFEIGKKLRLAIADPEKKETKAYLEKLKRGHYQVQLNLASDTGILAKIKKIRALQSEIGKQFENKNAEIDIHTYEEEIKNLQSLEQNAENMIAQEVLNSIFVGALRTEASDIHFQPEESQIIVRFRIDGVLHDILNIHIISENDLFVLIKINNTCQPGEIKAEKI